MSDLIRRSDAIKAFEDVLDCDYPFISEETPRERIEAIPTAWIPCSERLPEEDEEVLVCDKDGTMEVCDLEMFGRGIGLKWTDKNGYECWLDVVAWMPLPEPYKEGE